MLEFTEKIAVEEAEQSKFYLQEAGQPLPEAFDETDVNINARPVFTDTFVVLLKYGLAQASLTVYSLSLNTSTRADIRAFYTKCLQNSSELTNRCSDLMLDKGLHQPQIHLPVPVRIEKVDSESYIAGWFTDRRPINAQEIGQIIYHYRATEIHKEVIKTAIQVTKTKEFKKHFERGVDIYQKHLDVFKSILSENNLPKLTTWENEILDTTDSPFSDRIWQFKHAALTAQVAARYGAASSSVMRKDIGAMFLRLMSETLKYGEDAAELLIKHKYLDQLPMVKESPGNSHQ